MIAFSRLQMPVNSISSSVIVKGMEVGEARNWAANYVKNLSSRPKYLMFLGDDMLPPWDAVIKLIDEMETGKWDMLAGLYYAKQEPPFPVMWRDNIVGTLKPFIHYEPGEIIWTDVCGMDFTLIRVEVFDKLDPPYFMTGPVVDRTEGFLASQFTEDVYFCKKVREAGMSIGVHTGIRIAHYNYKSGEVF